MPNAQIISPGDLLRQALSTALEDMAARIALPSMTQTDVHRVRRAAKRARALARLAPADLSHLARRTRALAARVRRMLGGARDADVRRATLARLRPRLGEHYDRLATALDRADEHARARTTQKPALALTSAGAELADLIAAWRAPADIAGDGVVERAARTYRKARRGAARTLAQEPRRGAARTLAQEPRRGAARTLAQEPRRGAARTLAQDPRRRAAHATPGASADLHRWRTSVVDHEYQAALLSACAPHLRRQAARADDLRECLGDILDLDMLAAFLRRALAGDEADVLALRALDGAVARRRAKRLERARKLARRMFDDKRGKWARACRDAMARRPR